MTRAAAVVLSMAAALAGCAGPGHPPDLGRPSLALVVEVAATGRVLHRELVHARDTFTLAYVHSSEHVPVRGVFLITADHTMRVTETAFGGFGPGLPALGPGDEWRVEDGMIVAGATGAAGMAELLVRVASTTRHTLVTPGGTTLDLSALMGERGGAVKISLR